MRQVIRINEEKKEERELKPIELTHYMRGDSNGWEISNIDRHNLLLKLVYIGFCPSENMDIFVGYYEKVITFYKGHLNDGVY